LSSRLLQKPLDKSLTDPNDFSASILEHARRVGVVPDIHKEDFIFQFLINNPSFNSKDDAVRYYFTDGESSSKKLLHLIPSFLNPLPPADVSVLEFASGFGCVSRHLVKQRGYKITACDIHSSAVSFLARTIGVEALQSEHKPESFRPSKAYDVVFALSFFSHMPDATWARWLSVLFRAVKPGGLLIFTTQGRKSARFFGDPALDKSGYWFRPDSEQKDLDTSEYGQTIVSPGYVFSKLAALPAAWPCFFEQAYWWGHQDTYVLQKDPSA